jgi:hypothetical protein
MFSKVFTENVKIKKQRKKVPIFIVHYPTGKYETISIETNIQRICEK